MSQQLRNLQARLDKQAIDQLRAEVAKLAKRVETLEQENEQLEARANSAEEWAESWRDDFINLQLSSHPDSSPGITQDGRLVIVKAH